MTQACNFRLSRWIPTAATFHVGRFITALLRTGRRPTFQE